MQLDQLLEGLDVGVAAFAICEVRREASLVLQDEKAASIHYVLSGSGVAQPMMGPEIPLAPHTVLIAPATSCLVVTSGAERELVFPDAKCSPLPGGWDWNTVGEGEPGIVLACGAVRATHNQTVGLFDYLRAPLVECVADEPAFQFPFRQLLDELAAPKPGTRVLARMLMKQCLIAILRRQFESGECSAPWLTTLDHPRLGATVTAMLDRPETQFTLQGLADIAGMSRATFAERFREAFGKTPMGFLTEVRLRRAADLLGATDLPVKTIAAQVGFASRSYFSRAFKAFTGWDPARFRANAAQDAAPRSPDPAAPRPESELSTV